MRAVPCSFAPATPSTGSWPLSTLLLKHWPMALRVLSRWPITCGCCYTGSRRLSLLSTSPPACCMRWPVPALRAGPWVSPTSCPHPQGEPAHSLRSRPPVSRPATVLLPVRPPSRPTKPQPSSAADGRGLRRSPWAPGRRPGPSNRRRNPRPPMAVRDAQRGSRCARSSR
jgi:hypothetical protein